MLAAPQVRCAEWIHVQKDSHQIVSNIMVPVEKRPTVNAFSKMQQMMEWDRL